MNEHQDTPRNLPQRASKGLKEVSRPTDVPVAMERSNEPQTNRERFCNDYVAAQKITVHWCPLINYPKLKDWAQGWDSQDWKRRPPRGVGPPRSERVFKACSQLAGTNLGQRDQKRILDLLPWLASTSAYFDDNYRVALVEAASHARERWHVAFDGAQLGQWISFGLWEGNKNWARQPPHRHLWALDINVSRQYAPEKLPGPNEFLTVLSEFARAMWQETIFVLVEDETGNETAWFYGQYRGEFSLEPPQPLVKWRLHQKHEKPWHEQLISLRGELHKDQPHEPHIKDLLSQAMQHAAHGLGATFAPGAQEGILEVRNAGGARFLFAPFFWSRVNEPMDENRHHLLAQLFGFALDNTTAQIGPASEDSTASEHHLLWMATETNGCIYGPARSILYETVGEELAEPTPCPCGLCTYYRNTAPSASHLNWVPDEPQNWMISFLHGLNRNLE